ncbi:MAG: 23S rRNA (uracil-5-)-methyltransferase RumA, partial [Clostridia bacterium]|nr:23S rRNA (uracil-5-)-methyltransferase RumA [Clostridia bacterium]
MKKNDVILATCDSTGYNGEGIFHYNGTTIFVPYVLCGETAKVHILKVKGSIAFGKALEIVTPSKDRVLPKCAVFNKCGGCMLQHASSALQDKIKTETVQNCFKKIAGIDVSVDGVISGQKLYGYRNKL